MSHSTAPAPAYTVRIMADGELIESVPCDTEHDAMQEFDVQADRYSDGRSPAEYTIDIATASGDVIASSTVTPWADVTPRDEQGYRIGKADSITAEDEPSAEGGQRPEDQPTCIQCGNDVDEWGQVCGYCNRTESPEDLAQYDAERYAELHGLPSPVDYAIPPMPGAPRRRPTAAWPRPALSSVAGLAALRMAVGVAL